MPIPKGSFNTKDPVLCDEPCKTRPSLYSVEDDNTTANGCVCTNSDAENQKAGMMKYTPPSPPPEQWHQFATKVGCYWDKAALPEFKQLAQWTSTSLKGLSGDYEQLKNGFCPATRLFPFPYKFLKSQGAPNATAMIGRERTALDASLYSFSTTKCVQSCAEMGYRYAAVHTLGSIQVTEPGGRHMW